MSTVDLGLSNLPPITNVLPIDVSPQYKIEYGRSKKYPNDYSKGAIHIRSASTRDKNDAVEMIYDAGYDPSDYELIFEPM